MTKKCTVGSSCKNSCIEKTDQCRVKPKPKTRKMLDSVRHTTRVGSGAINEQDLFNKMMGQMDEVFSSKSANILAKRAIDNINTISDVKLMGDLRHQTKADNGQTYDKILDTIRAEGGFDNRSWNRFYSKAKNTINGKLARKLVDAKQC